MNRLLFAVFTRRSLGVGGCLLLLALRSMAQCDTTGILLELQATTDIQGILLGQNRCIKPLKLGPGVSLTADTLKVADNQTLSISGNLLTIQRGNTVTLPSGGSQLWEDFGIVTGSAISPTLTLPGAGQEWRVNLYRSGLRMTLNKDYIISSGNITLYNAADAEPIYLIVTQ